MSVEELAHTIYMAAPLLDKGGEPLAWEQVDETEHENCRERARLAILWLATPHRDYDFDGQKMPKFKIIVNSDHPYAENLNDSGIVKCGNKFEVRWRDFSMMKQEAEFDTIGAAKSFQDDLRISGLIVDEFSIDQAYCQEPTVELMLRSWEDLALDDDADE